MRPDRSRGDWVIDCGKVQGRRRVFRRKTRTEADSKASELRDERTRLGEVAFSLTAEQRIEAAQCYDMMRAAACPVSIISIVDDFLRDKNKREAAAPMSLGEAIDSRIMDQRRRGLRSRSIESTISKLRTFAKGNETYLITEIQAHHIHPFLNRMTAPTQAAYIRELNAFFNFCMKRGYCAANPLDGIEPPRVDRGLPEYMSADNVSRFMQALYNSEYAQYSAHAAIGFFAGLRPDEIKRIGWSSVNTDEGIITIGADIAKTRRVRHVTISENLAEWLRTQAALAGDKPLTYGNYDHVRRTICRRLELDWPHDCARHTYATFHIAMHRDAALTAHELGHTQGVDLLYKHYRGLAGRDDAEKFWNILPQYEGESE